VTLGPDGGGPGAGTLAGDHASGVPLHAGPSVSSSALETDRSWQFTTSWGLDEQRVS